MDFSLLGVGLRKSFEREGFFVDEIPIQGDIFRLLVRLSVEPGSAGVEVYMQKNIPVLCYTANIAIHENLSKYLALSTEQKAKFVGSLEEILEKQNLSNYEIIDDGNDFSVLIQCTIPIPFERIEILAESFDNINMAGNAVLDFLHRQFPK